MEVYGGNVASDKSINHQTLYCRLRKNYRPGENPWPLVRIGDVRNASHFVLTNFGHQISDAHRENVVLQLGR